jgi:alpha-beta hydrolase superfamily lysophospholipase
MTLSLDLDNPSELSVAREVTFAGDEVRLAGQIDYPVTTQTPNGFPLLFILHHAGWNTREDYQHIAELALECGYAVFRWDKRGTGRSGASGRGSSSQDAVNAYTTALEQAGINRKQAVIAAFGSGSALLGSAFGLFARVQHPRGALLVANMLDAEAVIAVDCAVKIIGGDEKHMPWQQYAEQACMAHRQAYAHGASWFVAHQTDQVLRLSDGTFHPQARAEIEAWLKSLCQPASCI